MEVEAGLGVGIEYSPDALGSPDRDGALLRDDLVAVRHLDDAPGARLNELEVGSAAFPHPIGLRGRVHLGWICSHALINSLLWLKGGPTANCHDVDADCRLTEMKTRSASLIAESMSVEKNKFLPRHDSTTSLRPGCGGEGWRMGSGERWRGGWQ